MYNLNLLVHWRKITDAAAVVGAEVRVDFDSLRLDVISGEKCLQLVPTFAVPRRYLGELTLDAFGFSGWRVVPPRTFELALDALKFKAHCEANGIRTPRTLMTAADGEASALMKAIRSTQLRRATRGPYRMKDVRDIPEGFFLEELIDGDGIEAWYWSGSLAYVRRRSRPSITGNGKSSIRQLAESRYGSVDWKAAEPLLQWQTTQAEAVPTDGVKVILDYRFNSGFHGAPIDSENLLGSMSRGAFYEQLAAAGPLLAKGLPIEAHQDSLICVGGIVDANERVWFLGMDERRGVPPEAYIVMFENFFGIRLSNNSPMELRRSS